MLTLTNILIVEEGGIPNFKHDCGTCIFLGAGKRGEKTVDLYACEHEDGVELIIRDGNEEEDNSSFDSKYASGIYSQVLKLYKDNKERKENQLIAVDNVRNILSKMGLDGPSDFTINFAQRVLVYQNR
jgi:hypothetical protein